VDRFTLFLINNRVVSSEDFVQSEEEGCFLQPDALKRYFEHYEKRMNEPFQDLANDGKSSYRTLFRQQAYKLLKTIQMGEPYKPYRIE